MHVRAVQKTRVKARCYLMVDDTGSGSEVNPHTYICTHAPSCFLPSWRGNCPRGPKHRTRKEARGEEERREVDQGTLYECVDVREREGKRERKRGG